jgi:hypothetical protein
MADYYTSFSFILELDKSSRDQALALYERLQQVIGDGSACEGTEPPPQDGLTLQAIELAAEMDDWLGFMAFPVDSGVWIRDCDENGSPNNVAVFVQAVLKMLGSKALVAFAWADTCSKPRTDGFGGGAAAITRQKIDYVNTSAWCSIRKEQHTPSDDDLSGLIAIYLENKGQLCPVCGSPEIVGDGGFDVDAGGASQEIGCNNCQSSWMDVYALSGFESLQRGQPS